MKRHCLNGTWKMTGNGYEVEGQVPGSVYSFLYLDNALLPDPYYRDNEGIYTELAEHEYVFEKKFFFTPTGNPVRLVFEGLDTLCTVYLNGVKIADTDNMHLCYTFDVDGAIIAGENHLRVVCHPVLPYMRAQNEKKRLFGAYDCMEGYPHVRKAHCMMGWDWGPRLPDAGIWRSVYLVEKDSAELTDVHIFQRHEGGRVFVKPDVVACGGEVEVLLTSPNGKTQSLIPCEENEVENPLLWWPNGLGEQHLYEVTVLLKEGGKTVDTRSLKIGLRECKLIRKKDESGESFYHEINGVAMFAMGADYIPEDNIFRRITPERTRTLLTHCKNSHFNTVRVWGGGYYPDDYFFELCDELGLLVFFDLMFACSVYEPDEKMNEGVLTEITQNIRRIRHHACLGLICGNNEIEWHFAEYVAISGRSDLEHLQKIYFRWFEDEFPKALAAVAPYLPYIPSSPTSVGGFRDPNGEGYGDCHDWEPDFMRCRNRFYRYVSEFGFESFPCVKTVESFTLPAERNPFSKMMDKHHRSNGGNELIVTYLARNFPHPDGLENFVYASQVLQAEAIRYRVEHFRRHRGRCMGTLYWQLNDIWPATSWASIDYYGRYKALQYAAKRFYAPVLLSCEEVGFAQTRPFINTENGTYNEEKSARFCVTNDTVYEVKCKIEWELRDENSRVLQSGAHDVTVAPLSVAWLEKTRFERLDPEKHHLHFTLIKDGETLSCGSVLFTLPKYYAFENPRLRCEREGDELVIYSEAYAKHLQIEGVDGDLLLEDNFFDMEKGVRRIRILSGDAKTVRLRSLYDLQ
ncbi:MAG: glycoside hydrolase family 2 protein [Clostridia bacterium]|nr:glycoside hydrolase family 2 protein [Clostridia bacterium]MBQ3505343.1 glycoside hydrolase family 2 protein [Clostridia bacterium]